MTKNGATIYYLLPKRVYIYTLFKKAWYEVLISDIFIGLRLAELSYHAFEYLLAR